MLYYWVMNQSHIHAVQSAARILGSKAALARALGVTSVTVGQWQHADPKVGRGVPPKQAVRIERLTSGAVTRRDLRPDDWLDIWPELANAAIVQSPSAPAATETVARVAHA